jgi:microcystin degradation protein MlrC
MKLFMATLSTETNTFSPIPTGRQSFMGGPSYWREGAGLAPPAGANEAHIEWRRLAGAGGHRLVESLCASAQPAGTTVRAVYEELRDMLLQDLARAMPVDGVLLKMHGAMVAEGYDDCEGDTLARVREIVGAAIPVGIELDLHCHLTDAIIRHADIVITYKEYPHIDVVARAREVYRLVEAAAQGRIRPVTAVHDCRMISMWRTPVEPVRGFVQRMQALEGKDGILSVSFAHGFPWADVDDVGAKAIVIADKDAAKAKALAARLGQEIWAMREATQTGHDTIDEAIDAALAAAEGPVVLADVADNAGGGAPSDSTFVLARLIERGVTGAALGCLWDPVAVGFCMEAGVGASIPLRLGGKCGPVSGPPLDLTARVRGLAVAHSQAGLGAGRVALGPSVWISAEGVEVIVNSIRNQVMNPDAFTGLGCELDDKQIVVVKSMQHFYAGFAPIAKGVRYIAGPGTVGPDFAAIPYVKFRRPYWPRVADPFTASHEEVLR